jgi:hypothetical protein
VVSPTAAESGLTRVFPRVCPAAMSKYLTAGERESFVREAE